MGVIFKNNVMYGVGDIEISPVIYSEEEREVGCWVDGKPLYEKTVFIDNISSSTGIQRFAHGISNIETVITTNGTWINKSDNTVYIGSRDIVRPDSINSSAGAWADATNIVLSTRENRSNQNLYITIQYTKTTDTPGSGIWTPSGVPAVHYSTDEHVVGTWIDGSTLYERTYIDIGFTGTTDTTIVDANIKSNSGIYNVKSITGLWAIGGFGYSDATTQAFGETGIFNGGSQTLYARVTPNGLAVVRTNTNFGYRAFLTVQYTKTTS